MAVLEINSSGGSFSAPDIFWITSKGNQIKCETHSIYVWEQILGKKISQKDFNNGNSPIHKKEFKGLTETEIKILKNEIDPRDYMISKGWLRCRKEGRKTIIQANQIDNRVKKLDAEIFDIEIPSGFYQNVPKSDLGGMWKYRL